MNSSSSDDSDLEIVTDSSHRGTTQGNELQGTLDAQGQICDNCKQRDFADLLPLRCEHSLCKNCCLRSLADDSGNLLNSLYCPVQSCFQKLPCRDCFKILIYLFYLEEHKAVLEYWKEEATKLDKQTEEDSRCGLVSLCPESVVWKKTLCYCGCTIEACVEEWTAEPTTLPSLARFHCGLARILSIQLQIDRLTTSFPYKMTPIGISTKSETTTTTTTATRPTLVRLKHLKKCTASGVGYGGSSREMFWENYSHKRKSANDDSIMSSVFECLMILIDPRLGPYPLFLWNFLHASIFTPIAANLLRNNSLYDVCSRLDLYMNLFRLLKKCIEDFTLQLLLFIPISSSHDYDGKDTSNICLADLLGDFERNICFLQKSTLHGSLEIPQSETLLINIVAETCAQVRSVRTLYQRFTNHLQSNTKASITKPLTNCEDVSTEYCNRIRELQFQTMENLSKLHSLTNHHYVRKEWNASKGRTFRLAKEISSLRNDLPLFYGSSIIVRVDEENFDVFRVLILGPEGTPYSNGAFFFDFLLPMEYPEKPPIGRFLNTRRGEIRCNPNLYNSGKICLSLLGTWQGPCWSSQCTLLQVLVSIQSFIFVGEPYFNEPGFEEFQSTVKGKRKSKAYNLFVQDYTVKYGMLDILKKPYKGFEQILKEHFCLKRRQIIRQVEEWHQQANEWTASTCRNGEEVFSEFTGSSSSSRVSCGVQLETLRKLRNALEQL